MTGYFGQSIDCTIDAIIYRLVESSWTWKDSYRYLCETKHGTSGSPIAEKNTRTIVGINNTGNDDGEQCTLDNPCEVTREGTRTGVKGRNYGQRIDRLYTCVDKKERFNLKQNGCAMLGGDSYLRE